MSHCMDTGAVRILAESILILIEQFNHNIVPFIPPMM